MLHLVKVLEGVKRNESLLGITFSSESADLGVPQGQDWVSRKQLGCQLELVGGPTANLPE